MEISFQLEARQLRKNGWNSSHNTRKTMHSPSLTSLYSVPQLVPQLLSTSVAATPAVQLNSIFSAKTDPRESSEKNPEVVNKPLTTCQQAGNKQC